VTGTPPPEPVGATGRRLDRAGAFLFVIFAAAAILAALEWAARGLGFDQGNAIRYEPPRVPGEPYTGRRLRGPAWLIDTPVVHYNAIGDRAPAPEDFSCAHPILVLGDSMTEGLWIPDDQVWPAVLQARFAANGVCIYHGAHSGDGARRELGRYLHLSGRVGFADVIIAAYANDIRLPVDAAPKPIARVLPGLLSMSGWLGLRWSWNRRSPGMLVKAGAIEGRDRNVLDRSFDQYFTNLGRLIERVSADGRRAALLAIPKWSWMIAGDREFELRLRAWARRHGVPFATVGYDDFRDTPFFINDLHPNVEGHAGYARAAAPLVEALLDARGASAAAR